jgi:RHS repeat-associated protein
VDFPFDISDKNFEIRYNDSMFSDTAAYDVLPGHGGSGVSAGNFYSSSSTTLSNSTPGISRTAELFNTYYIYTFDGKLLAEYDHNGNCIRDYIYAGNRLIAEYKPQTVEYFYYMTDQINSTRMITNGSGNVVFSEAYGPYGDVQKTWINTYDPKLKFSGKEREGYSDLDYFGARYYDHKNYRFNSVDPLINKIEALYNPQLWNLYAYCQNNPVTYLDPDGRQSILDKFKNITGKFAPDNMVPPIVWMEGYKENIQGYEKMVSDAIKITAGAAILAAGIEIVSGEGGQNKKISEMSRDERKKYFMDKGVPENEIGPSGYPKKHFGEYKSRKHSRETSGQSSNTKSEFHNKPTRRGQQRHFHDKKNRNIHHGYGKKKRKKG